MTDAAEVQSAETSLSEEARATIGTAPALVFLLVAAADGDIDRKELKTFQKLIASNDYQVLLAMMMQAGSSPGEIVQGILASERPPLEQLAAVSQAIDEGLPPESAQAVKVMLLALAKSIAEASGGLLGLFGKKISEEETAALAVIAHTLGLLRPAGDAPAGRAGATELAAGPDNLYPLLKASDWAEQAKGTVLLRSVYGDEELAPGEPVVAYAIDTPTSVQFVNADELADSLTADALHEGALANLEKRLSSEGEWCELEEDLSAHGLGVVKGVVYCGDFYCAEALLSRAVLMQAHERLGCALLMVSVPERGKLFATELASQDRPEPEKAAFMQYAVKHFFNSNEAPIGPTVWIARTGKVVGQVEGMEGIIESAERIAREDREEEDGKLVCTARKTAPEGAFGVHLDVVTQDVDVMLKRLQHVVRELADNARSDEAFNWQIHVNLSIEDPDYDAASEPELRAMMDDMFAFLTEQLRAIFGGAGHDVALTYTIAS